MKRMPLLSLLALSLVAALPAQAQINRCVGADGKVEFRNMACPPTSVTASAHVRPTFVGSAPTREPAADKTRGARVEDAGSKGPPQAAAPARRP